MARRVQVARVKANRTYTVGELAETLGMTEPTIRRWMKEGLPALIGQRPALILGCDVKAFLAGRAERKKRPLGPYDLFCLSCKAPTRPAYGIVDYTPLSPTHGRLSAFCTQCEGPCQRIIQASDLPRWIGPVRVAGNNAATA